MISKIIIHTIASVAFVLVIAIYSTASTLFHLQRVEVSGDSEVVSPNQIRRALKGAGKMSLVFGDFVVLEDSIRDLPAVRDTKVVYKLPNEIELQIMARKAVARSVDGGLIDNTGEWYLSDTSKELPIFAMDRGVMPRAVEFYASSSEKLKVANLGITQLHKADDGWRVFLSNGWVLMLGSSKINSRLDRFVGSIDSLRLALDEGTNLRFDLRYPHGFAVAGLRTPEDKNG